MPIGLSFEPLPGRSGSSTRHPRRLRAPSRAALAEKRTHLLQVRRGHAVAYTRYSQRYVLEERAARRDNAGAWAYGFTPPEDWRRAS